MAEFVKLSPQEIFYGKRNLLESQLGMIGMIKKMKNFHHLRKEELLLRIKLKKTVDEAKEAIKILDKVLPKANLPKEKVEKIMPKDEQTVALEVEIDSIRDKLSRLQQ